MATMKTPGVYIQEKDAFGNSVVPVPTAVPVFIGYTEKISYGGQDLINTPVKISSLADFTGIFGVNPPAVKFGISQQPLLSKLKSYTADLAAATAEVTNATAALDALADDASDEDKASAETAVKMAEALKASIEGSNTDDTKSLIEAYDAWDQARKDEADDVGDKKKAYEELAETYALVIPDFASEEMGYLLDCKTVNYRLYSALKFFYANGGADCYIISVGEYDYSEKTLEAGPFIDAIKFLEKESEPTMVVIPDAVEIKDKNKTDLGEVYAGCYSVQSAMMNHCGEFQNRIAVLDVPGGFREKFGEDPVTSFRSGAAPSIAKYNSYGAAYYPWLHTNVQALSSVNSGNIDEGSYTIIHDMLSSEFAGVAGMDFYYNAFSAEDGKKAKMDEAESVLGNLSTMFSLMNDAILKQLNLMAPSAAMAGLYTAVDNSQGVWIAPANVAVQNVITPAIKIDHAQQEDLNVPLNGKSICAIRAFTGKGTIVWGARTLDGNSNDWRYINVRRTMIYLEQSVKEAAQAYVFAPNDAGTWVSVKSMISNFLVGVWKQGGLVGPSPDTAFSVSVGLGNTMSSDDILNGIMRVTVKVAVSRPAEFIEITFQQQQQQA